MRHTLVAAFKSSDDANRTRGDLMSRGIPREQIHAVGADSAEIHAYDAPYSTEGGSVDREHHESRVAHFFKSLFGNDDHEEHRRHAEAYPEAVRRGALVIAVDVMDDGQMLKARDALEYNGAIDINQRGADGSLEGPDTGALRDYPGPSSPYAGATGGDSHLDKHFTRPRSSGTDTTAGDGRYSESERPGAAGPIGSAAGSGQTSDTTATGLGDSSTTDTSPYDVGSAAKRAGTDYPETTATTAPTGAGSTGHGSSVGATAPGAAGSTPPPDASQAGPCDDRVCVIRRPDDDQRPG